ncbi:MULTISPECIES: hypothetical protein [unclassified Granulicatella]|uniref:hypothetical protein n=1 Tax=unclassified Granulicatella TaxID=2630493 RepID=UPI001074030C|nr:MULTISPECIES: hypothetical protein [unclassified Granulicatella]MBF0780788.1 hypothetical protein [Granulicatella sp. 19428wC4_WM01]TFU93833.1 hypothetical protein E4T68_06720 [Granulicatella sp. WM01]
MKKILLTLMMVMVGLLILTTTVFYNLKSNSVYYAKNMPRGEGQKPELVMLIDNLDWIYKPNTEGIKYDFDGTRDIINETGSKGFGNIYSDKTEYVYSNGDSIVYRFTKNFELKHATRLRKMETVDISSVDKNKLVEEIEQFVKPVMDEQTKPMINLQWLFNLLYQDEFK